MPTKSNRPKKTQEQKFQDVLKKNQNNISPMGVAAADAAAKKALEKKYPGMFIPGVRKTAGVKRGN